MITTNTEGITQTYAFDQIKFKNDQDMEIEIPIGIRIKGINIKVEGKITNVRDLKEKTVSHSHNITLNNYKQ